MLMLTAPIYMTIFAAVGHVNTRLVLGCIYACTFLSMGLGMIIHKTPHQFRFTRRWLFLFMMITNTLSIMLYYTTGIQWQIFDVSHTITHIPVLVAAIVYFGLLFGIIAWELCQEVPRKHYYVAVDGNGDDCDNSIGDEDEEQLQQQQRTLTAATETIASTDIDSGDDWHPPPPSSSLPNRRQRRRRRHRYRGRSPTHDMDGLLRVFIGVFNGAVVGIFLYQSVTEILYIRRLL